MDYFKFASENARREFAQPDLQNVKICLCKCQVVAGGYVALNHACPLHGDPAYREYLTSELDPRD